MTLWRGDLSPLGREAPPKDRPSQCHDTIGAAAQPSGDKSPRHKKPPTRNLYRSCNCANPPIKARVLPFTQARTLPLRLIPRSFHAHVQSPRRPARPQPRHPRQPAGPGRR
ncbi:hypothetical protein DZG01_30335 [Pseudomonas fluorescens]|nr:hypothetical protein DZG01_30335 [Pseudomonas fluorescens]